MEGMLARDEAMLARVPYQGLVTFWRAPHTQDLEGADLAVYGIPFDCEIFNRPGTRYGPRAIREQSLYVGLPGIIWPFTYDLRTRHKLIDTGDVFFYPGCTDEMLSNAEKHVDRLSERGVGTVGLGGDHLIAYPAIKSHAKTYGQLSLIHFDAHTDTHGGPVLNHGSMFIYAANEKLLDAKSSVQVAIRTLIPETDFTVIAADECLEIGAKAIIKRIKEVVGDRPCYISLDVDGMDPAYAPGTGTPLPGGITSAAQREILWGLRGMNVVGGDVVEVSPPYDPSHITSILGATLAMDILYVLAESPLLAKQKEKARATTA